MDIWDNVLIFLSCSRLDGSFSTAARLLVSSWVFPYSFTILQNYSLNESLMKQKKHKNLEKKQ